MHPDKRIDYSKKGTSSTAPSQETGAEAKGAGDNSKKNDPAGKGIGGNGGKGTGSSAQKPGPSS